MPRCGYKYPDTHEYGASLPVENFYLEKSNTGRTRWHGRCKACERKAHRIRYHTLKRTAELNAAVALPEEDLRNGHRSRRQRVLDYDASDALPFSELSPAEQQQRYAAIRRDNMRKATLKNRVSHRRGDL